MILDVIFICNIFSIHFITIRFPALVNFLTADSGAHFSTGYKTTYVAKNLETLNYGTGSLCTDVTL